MTAKPVKLSTAQRILLRQICIEAKYVAAYYTPAKELVSKGLAAWSPASSHLAPTPKGREVNELSA